MSYIMDARSVCQSRSGHEYDLQSQSDLDKEVHTYLCIRRTKRARKHEIFISSTAQKVVVLQERILDIV